MTSKAQSNQSPLVVLTQKYVADKKKRLKKRKEEKKEWDLLFTPQYLLHI